VQRCTAHAAALAAAPDALIRGASELLLPRRGTVAPGTGPPACAERFACLLCGALDTQLRQAEAGLEQLQLHGLWRVVAVSLLWCFWADYEEKKVGSKRMGAPDGALASLSFGSDERGASTLAEAFSTQALGPLLEEERRRAMDAAERQADQAMAELLGEDSSPALAKLAKKKGKRPQAQQPNAGPAVCTSMASCEEPWRDASGMLVAEQCLQEQRVNDSFEEPMPSRVVQSAASVASVWEASWARLSAQLLMMAGTSKLQLACQAA